MTQLIEAMQWSRIPVGASASVGTIDLVIGTVGNGNPVGLITAGIHGDEGPWGSWAIRKLLESTPLNHLKGTLRVIPNSNPLAMEADLRNAPLDMLDLNRVFPGDPNGSHTERLAAAIVAHAADGADVIIDLHGGGSWCINAFAFQFAGSEDLAQAVGAPFLVTGPERTVTLTGYARSKGARVAAIEMGGRSEDEMLWADRIRDGVRRVLGVAGVLTPADSVPAESIPVGPSKVLRPTRGGVFVPELRTKDVARIVPNGTVLGTLHDPATREVIEIFRAPFPRTALLLLRPTVARLEGGAMTYVVAEPLA